MPYTLTAKMAPKAKIVTSPSLKINRATRNLTISP